MIIVGAVDEVAHVHFVSGVAVRKPLNPEAGRGGGPGGVAPGESEIHLVSLSLEYGRCADPAVCALALLGAPEALRLLAGPAGGRSG